MPPVIPRIALTPGEPAGIGPDLCVMLAQHAQTAQLVAVADPDLLARRAEILGLPLRLEPFEAARAAQAHPPGVMSITPVALAQRESPGHLNPHNAHYVLQTLETAVRECRHGTLDALVTAPVHKGVINDAGIPFTGHTEFLAAQCGAAQVVMMLVAGNLRVALATTHLPLRAVADAITPEGLESVLRVLHHDLRTRFGFGQPRILVCGLNPHAGEGGHLGREEIEIIEPVLARLRAEGMDLRGPLPADTAFTEKTLAQGDAVLAMYHDQGLPVLKHRGFGRAVNVTLGLPIVRTSVDHGTALDLAGSGRIDTGSLNEALALAIRMARH